MRIGLGRRLLVLRVLCAAVGLPLLLFQFLDVFAVVLLGVGVASGLPGRILLTRRLTVRPRRRIMRLLHEPFGADTK